MRKIILGNRTIAQETCLHDAKLKMAGFKNRLECTRCHKIIPLEPVEEKKSQDNSSKPDTKNREDLRKEMFAKHEQQKTLIKKRELLLSSGTDDDKKEAISVTHEIANLEDFIKKTENELRMTD